MQSLSDIKELLDSYGLRPSRSLGQNFLIDASHVMRLVEASGVRAGDVVLEVGPGTGVLTDVLLERGCRVVACELDRGLAALLRDRYAAHAERGVFTLIEGDCLSSKHALNPAIIEAIGAREFRLVANLPYGAASPLMILLATEFAGCVGQFVTIQREVAERLRAEPGTRDYGEMGVLVQAMCEVKRIASLPPGCFWPSPKVTSEMVAVTPRVKPLTDDAAYLSRLCRMLFTQRRKQVGTILAREAPELLSRLPEGVDRTKRPEELTVTQLVEMSRVWTRGR